MFLLEMGQRVLWFIVVVAIVRFCNAGVDNVQNHQLPICELLEDRDWSCVESLSSSLAYHTVQAIGILPNLNSSFLLLAIPLSYRISMWFS